MMAPTEPDATTPVAPGAGGVDSHRDRSERVRQWIADDPVRTAAYAMIAVAVLIRLQVAARGFLAEDDFILANRAARSNLTVDFLFETYNNHVMPAGLLIIWVVTKLGGLVYWPYLLLLTVGQAVLGVSFFRLMRMLVRARWGQLLPLGILMFSPLTLDTTSMWAIGVFLLPMQLAIVWAFGAQVKYVRTRRKIHLVTLGGAVLFGLAFFEKSLLIVPLVVLMTACFLTAGGPLRSLYRVLRRDWPAWLVLAGITGPYLVLYLTRPPPPCTPLGCTPSRGFPADSFVGVVQFFVDVVGTTFIPGLLGGPWDWLYVGDGPPLAVPPQSLRWLTWVAFLALVVGTVLARRVASRAWMLLAGYVVLVVAMFAATRIGLPMGYLFGLVPRYVSDGVVIAALCIGVAMFGLKEPAGEEANQERPLPAIPREPVLVAAGLVLAMLATIAIGVGAAYSSAKFGDGWAVKNGRDYLHNATADLARAPADAVFFDQQLPSTVMPVFVYPDNLQSRFLGALKPRPPVFVSEAENPFIFDSAGHVRPAWVSGWTNRPGTVQEMGCGHRVADGKSTLIPMDGDIYAWSWAIRIGYLSNGESTATVRIGERTHQFDIHQGLRQITFIIETGNAKAVELTVTDPTVVLCTNQVLVGNVVPQPGS